MSATTKNLILVRGLPGAGKSTFVHLLEYSSRYEADQFMTDEYGNYEFRPERLGYCHSQCQWHVGQAMEHMHSIIVVSNTFTTEKEMKPYFEMAEKYGYRVSTIVVENRHGSDSVHDVPDTTLKRMRDRFSLKLL